MITDAQLRFSDAQDLSMAAGSVNSTNVVDLLVNGDIGRGDDMRAIVEVTTPFTSGGAATLDAQLVTSATANLASPTVLYDSGVVALANLGAGARVMDIKIPRTAQRYIGVIYTVAGATTTAGKVFAGLVHDTGSALSDRLVGVTSLT